MNCSWFLTLPHDGPGTHTVNPWNAKKFVSSLFRISSGHTNELSWRGGPLLLACEHKTELFRINGHYVQDNVIAIKAVAFKENIYVLTPRLKHGVVATVSLVVKTHKGVELMPYPDLSSHSISDCEALQNAVDFHLDHLGNLWVLDSGIVDTQQLPRCTCPPKVVEISLILGKVTRQFDLLTVAEPTSLLQSIAVEHTIDGRNFVYISDASRGAILVYDVAASTGWSVMACAPAAGLQMAITKRGLTHSVLVLVRVPHSGLLELDTGVLRRKESLSPLRVFGEHTSPVLVLGCNAHHIFLRYTGFGDVLSWDTRDAFDSSRLVNIHSPVPRLMPTSVAVEPFLHSVVILESNYAETVQGNGATYHRISFVDKIL